MAANTMTTEFSYTTKFKLDKTHLAECFDQSVVVDKSIMAYKRGITTLVFGMVLLYMQVTVDYISWFVISLGVLELFSTYYRKSWWLLRQMIGKSSNSEVTLIIDQQGVTTESVHVNTVLQWQKINAVEKTELGVILRHSDGVNYLSNSYLSAEAIDFIFSQKVAQ